MVKPPSTRYVCKQTGVAEFHSFSIQRYQGHIRLTIVKYPAVLPHHLIFFPSVPCSECGWRASHPEPVLRQSVWSAEGTAGHGIHGTGGQPPECQDGSTTCSGCARQTCALLRKVSHMITLLYPQKVEMRLQPALGVQGDYSL